jgi:chromate transporter
MTTEQRLSPGSLAELFWALSGLALQGFGGVLPVARRVLVDQHKWYTEQEFLEEWGVAQVMPGPNVVNLAVMLGARNFGAVGAFVAIFGLLLFPSILLVFAAIFLQQFRDHPIVGQALHGMGAVSAGLMAGSSLKMLTALKNHPLTFPIAVLITIITFVLLGVFRLPFIPVLLAIGSLSMALTYWRISRQVTDQKIL